MICNMQGIIRLLLLFHPRGAKRCHLLEHRAILIMRSRQVARGHEEFVYNLAASENECFFEKLRPLFLRQRMMSIQPAFEGIEFFSQSLNSFGVLDGGVNLEAIANDARICKQTSSVLFREFSNFINVEAAVGFAEIIGFLKDRDPRESSLVDLKNKTFEEQVVIREWKSVLGVVIRSVENVFGMRITIFAIGGH
jgi:hypothetical protein